MTEIIFLMKFFPFPIKHDVDIPNIIIPNLTANFWFIVYKIRRFLKCWGKGQSEIFSLHIMICDPCTQGCKKINILCIVTKIQTELHMGIELQAKLYIETEI